MSSGSLPKLFPLSRRFNAGDLIGGKYRLVRQIGAGAMGAVWVAHNDMLDVDVAIKLLRVDNQKADPQRLYKRLLQEARAAARLGHPGIVRVFDFGRAEDNSPFIVMELLEGESLADVMSRQRRTAPVRSVQLLLPIIDALATAHGRGIVHRDIKPENIFLAKDEYGRIQPKIVDFGVARFAEAGRSLTRSGALLGTPDYMAPEQARGELDIDHRVDIWALSTVLYELITGCRPFGRESANYLAVLRAIVHEQPASILQYGVGDAALWLILDRGLRKRRNERWETIRVLGEALALWLYERGVAEDALGASIKTTWLESGLDGVKIDVADSPKSREPRLPETPPPPPSRTLNATRPELPPPTARSAIGESMTPEKSAPVIAPPPESLRSDPQNGVFAETELVEPRTNTRWYFAALLFAVCGFAAAMWLDLISPEAASENLPFTTKSPESRRLDSPRQPPRVQPEPPPPAAKITQPSSTQPVATLTGSDSVAEVPPVSPKSTTATKVAVPKHSPRPAPVRSVSSKRASAPTVTSPPGTRAEAPAASPPESAPATRAPSPPAEQSGEARKKSLPPPNTYDFGF